MPEISLTDFVDFVIKAGSPKLALLDVANNRLIPQVKADPGFHVLLAAEAQAFITSGGTR